MLLCNNVKHNAVASFMLPFGAVLVVQLSDVGHFILKGYDMYFVKFLTIMMLVLASILMGFTIIMVSIGTLTPDWLFIAVPYIGACCLSVWAAD